MKRNAGTAAGTLVIGLDSSTTGTKALALDRRGRVLAQASAPIPLSSPGPNLYEQDPADWWRAACRALKTVAAKVGKQRIAALAVSNQRETFVPLGVDRRPLRPAIIWLDERCKSEVGPFSKMIGEKRLAAITGKPADYAPVVYRLAWMKRREPRLFKKIGMMCDVHAYLVWKLTGEFRTSRASADPLGLFDMKRRAWSPVILKALGLDETQLPAAFAPGTALGKVTAEAAEATGLAEGTLVAAGGGDGQAAGLGVNALTPGRAYLNLGTAVVAGVYGKTFRTGPAFRTLNSCSDSGYYYECSLRAGTFAVDWLVKSVLGLNPASDRTVYRALEEDARAIPPGSDGLFFVPYLCGVMNPYWDMNARGIFTGLSSAHGRSHLYRAVLEGIAFEQALALDAVEKATGERVRELAAIGGGTANKLWLSIIADVTGRRIVLPATTEASALGAGIAASQAMGWHANFSTAAKAMTRTSGSVRPDSRRSTRYRELFREYASLYPRLIDRKRI